MPFRNTCAAMGFFLLIGSPVLAAGDNAAATGAPVAIKLTRPFHVGDINEYSIHCISMRTMAISQQGNVVHSDTEFREISCVIRDHVLKVSKAGKILKRRAQLETFQVRNEENAPLKSLALAGAIIEGTLESATDDPTFKRSDGKPLSDEEKDDLGVVFFGTFREGSDEDDATFGPSGPVKVGDTWKANHEVFANGHPKAAGVTIPLSALTSEFTLTSQEAGNGVSYLKMSGTIHADPISMSLPNGRKGTPLSGTMQMALAKTLPIDPAKQAHDSSMNLQVSMKGTMEVSEGNLMDVALVMKQHEDTTTLPASK